MTFEEYTERLRLLRKEYADSIRNFPSKDDYWLIVHAENEAAEYRIRVEDLIAEYTAMRMHS